jgi:hypothetical protein
MNRILYRFPDGIDKEVSITERAASHHKRSMMQPRTKNPSPKADYSFSLSSGKGEKILIIP